MKKLLVILILFLISSMLFASGYIGIKTGPTMTFGNYYSGTIASGNNSTSVSLNQDFQDYYWDLGISGVHFFDDNRNHHMGLGYGFDFGFKMAGSENAIKENGHIDVIYVPYLGFAYQYEVNDLVAIDTQIGLGVQLGGNSQAQSGTTAIFHSVLAYVNAATSITPIDKLAIKAGLELGVPFYHGLSGTDIDINTCAWIGGVSIKPYLGLAYEY